MIGSNEGRNFIKDQFFYKDWNNDISDLQHKYGIVLYKD